MYSWSEIRSGADRVMAAVTCMLFALGLTSIYSAGIGVRSATMNFVIKQSVWGGVSAVIYLFILRVGYRNFVRMSYWFYGATLALLMALDALGTVSKGAVRWFQIGGIGFQPAELGKVTLILFLARFCSRHQPDTLKNLASSLALSGASVLMVLLQPDLGTSLVYIAIILSVLVVAGAPAKYLGGMLAAAVAALPLFLKVLKPYQLRRLVVFLDPYTDPQGAGYNVIQSRIAVGSGGLWGKGFLQGTQGRLKFLPEPHTDFIFSVFAEEFGFVGGVAVIILFSILFWRILRGAFRTKDTRAKLLCIGIVAWLWFQVMESVAMSMGLAPITGLPLPLFSYGGSSLLMVSIGLALAQSVAVSPVRDRFARIS
jgi:rod shape determining protein RodA